MVTPGRIGFCILLALVVLALVSNGATAGAIPAPAPPAAQSAVEIALYNHYRDYPARPISEYQAISTINEQNGNRLIFFTYRVADQRADYRNTDGSPHWEKVVGSGAARLNRAGHMIGLTIREDGEEGRASRGLVAFDLMPTKAQPNTVVTVAGIIWSLNPAVELRGATTTSLTIQEGDTPRVFAWSGPYSTIRCGFQIARNGLSVLSFDWSRTLVGSNGYEPKTRPECVGVAPFQN